MWRHSTGWFLCTLTFGEAQYDGRMSQGRPEENDGLVGGIWGITMLFSFVAFKARTSLL